MSLDRDASDRTFDRQLAYLGLLDDAAPLFRDGSAVPAVGVLLALACLVESGLLRISRKLYGEIGPAFYGLRTTLLTLLLVALLRIKRPEHLKERDPAAFGRLLGLDRAPEVKTLRRRLTRLAAHHRAEQLGAELRACVSISADMMGFLYVDGHVRAYHGERPIASKAYVARRHLAMPASTELDQRSLRRSVARDYRGGQRGVDEGLSPAASRSAGCDRRTAGHHRLRPRRLEPEAVTTIIKDGFDVLTYRVGRCRRIHERRFIRRRAEFDGCWVDYSARRTVAPPQGQAALTASHAFVRQRSSDTGDSTSRMGPARRRGRLPHVRALAAGENFQVHARRVPARCTYRLPDRAEGSDTHYPQSRAPRFG